MDGRTRYTKAIKILHPLIGETVPMNRISKLIMIDIGTTDTIIRDTLRFMIDLELIIERSHLMFEVMKPHFPKP